MKEGWKYMKLGEVCYFQNGFAFKSNQFEDNGIGVVRISDIKNGEVSKEKMTYINPNSFKEDLSSFLVKPNDILIAMSGGTTGKLGINKTNETFFQNQRVGLFREDKEKLNHNFLYYYLHTKSEESLKIAAGAAQPNLSTAQIKQFPIPVPPLSEQQRIVSFLDASFAKIETIKSNAQKNLDNAEQLWKAQLEKQFDNQKCEKKKLGEVCDVTDGDHLPPPKSETGYPFITISNINKDALSINFDDTFYVPENYYNALKDNKKPKVGDVLYTVTGSYGIPVLVDGKRDFCFQRHIGLIRPSSCLKSSFLFYWILTPTAKKIADEVATGTAQKTVSLKSLRNFEIPLPPLAEQERIVKELDALSAKINTLKANYRRQIECCDELRQSLLKKAFEGEL